LANSFFWLEYSFKGVQYSWMGARSTAPCGWFGYGYTCTVTTAFNPLMGTLKPQINGPFYSNTVIGTLGVDGWACYIWYSEKGPVWAVTLPTCPVLSLAIPNYLERNIVLTAVVNSCRKLRNKL